MFFSPFCYHLVDFWMPGKIRYAVLGVGGKGCMGCMGALCRSWAPSHGNLGKKGTVFQALPARQGVAQTPGKVVLNFKSIVSAFQITQNFEERSSTVRVILILVRPLQKIIGHFEYGPRIFLNFWSQTVVLTLTSIGFSEPKNRIFG